jgi:hypothetical protein
MCFTRLDGQGNTERVKENESLTFAFLRNPPFLLLL